LDTLQNLLGGFSLALSPENLTFAFIGSFIGTLLGVLPGVGSAAGMAILLPLTFQMPTTSAIIMLAAIFYGSNYGGTITSVLMNVPGEASTIITCLDGHQMAKKGRAGAALCIAAIGSFVGGTTAVVLLVIAAPPLAAVVVQFGPSEYFSLMVLGLSMFVVLAGKSVMKALLVGVLGLILATVGTDPASAVPRLTLGQLELEDGLAFIPVIMGVFGIGDILLNAEAELTQVFESKMGSMMPTRREVMDSIWPMIRGTGIGCFLGLIPGLGSAVSTFVSYAVEKKMSKYPEDFGTGVIEGVAGPETANNAHCDAALIPLLTMGIPTGPTIAILMGAFIMNGLTPGPLLFRDNPDVVWTIIASFYVGNVMLLILNLPLVGLWVKILKVPYSVLFALILVFAFVGAYSLDNSVFDIRIMSVFGVVGYFLKKLDFPLAPFALTFILGPRMELGLRQSLVLFRGDVTQFFIHPVSATLLTLALLILLSPALRILASRAKAANGPLPG